MSLSHLISIRDLACEEVILILDTVGQMAATRRHDIKKLPALQRKTVVNLFFEDSMCTHISFETIAKRLGADVINFQSRSSSVPKDESLKDTALTLEAMSADAVVMRHSLSGAAHRLTHVGWMNLPILNAGDGTHQHPTQALLDAMTLRRYCASSFGENGTIASGSGLGGAYVVIVGDVLHLRVACSNVNLLTLLGTCATLVTLPTLLPIGVEIWSCATSYSFDGALATRPDAVMMLRVQRECMSSVGDGFLPSPGIYHAGYGLTPTHFATLSPNTAVIHPSLTSQSLGICAGAADLD